MNPEHKKTALRMIPYGLYVLAAETSDGRVCASTVNWLTQASFDPPLVALGVKADSAGHEIVEQAGSFALSILGKGQQDEAFAFFKPVEREGERIGGLPFRKGSSGAPLLSSAIGWLECHLLERVSRGDHSIFVAEVIDADVAEASDERPDDRVLTLRELGEKVFYGG